MLFCLQTNFMDFNNLERISFLNLQQVVQVNDRPHWQDAGLKYFIGKKTTNV